jgi:hypothetical protein
MIDVFKLETFNESVGRLLTFFKTELLDLSKTMSKTSGKNLTAEGGEKLCGC